MRETVCSTIGEALSCHESGRLEDAERMYGSVLEQDPENADAWHLLGRVALARGDSRGQPRAYCKPFAGAPGLPPSMPVWATSWRHSVKIGRPRCVTGKLSAWSRGTCLPW